MILNTTYETSNHIHEDLLIAKHCKDLCNGFYFSVDKDNKRLLLILVAEILQKASQSILSIKNSPGISY